MGAVPGWSWQLTLRLSLEVLAKWGGQWCHVLLLNLHNQWHLNEVVLILLVAACMSCSHYKAVRARVRLRGRSESWANCLFPQHTLAKKTRKVYKFCLWMPLNSRIFRCFGTVPGYTPSSLRIQQWRSDCADLIYVRTERLLWSSNPPLHAGLFSALVLKWSSGCLAWEQALSAGTWNNSSDTCDGPIHFSSINADT